ncbi:MAG: phage tail protein [Chitinivibrionales bacterium]|nr:phage tail protein [Chitinivibrionales bacterium]
MYRKTLLTATLLLALACSVHAQDGFIGEIRMFAGNFAPRGWAFCDGQLLPISQHTALFSLLGTTYGGDGSTTFGLPDLRGRVPVHPGHGPGLTIRGLGEKGGQEQVTLTAAQMPSHTHAVTTTVAADSAVGTSDSPKERVPARNASSTPAYSDSATTTLDGVQTTASPSGGNQPHNNMQPYQAINFIICIVGVYPSRS